MDFATGTITLFQAVFECFNRIQLVRCFEDDFSVCQIKLDITQIRLAKWSQISGLNDAIQRGANASESSTNPQLDIRVRHLLEDTQDLLDRAQDNANKINRQRGKSRMVRHDSGVSIGSNQGQDADDGEPLDPESDYMPTSDKRIRNKLCAFLKRSSTNVSRANDSAKWAFYKKEHFETFVAQFSAIIDELESLFSSDESKKKLEQLSKEQCEDMSRGALKTLSEMADGCDSTLKAAAVKEMEEKTERAMSNSLSARDISGSISYGNSGTITMMRDNFSNNTGQVFHGCDNLRLGSYPSLTPGYGAH